MKYVNNLLSRKLVDKSGIRSIKTEHKNTRIIGRQQELQYYISRKCYYSVLYCKVSSSINYY